VDGKPIVSLVEEVLGSSGISVVPTARIVNAPVGSSITDPEGPPAGHVAPDPVIVDDKSGLMTRAVCPEFRNSG